MSRQSKVDLRLLKIVFSSHIMTIITSIRTNHSNIQANRELAQTKTSKAKIIAENHIKIIPIIDKIKTTVRKIIEVVTNNNMEATINNIKEVIEEVGTNKTALSKISKDNMAATKCST